MQKHVIVTTITYSKKKYYLLVLNPSDKKFQRAKMIKTQRPQEEINFD